MHTAEPSIYGKVEGEEEEEEDEELIPREEVSRKLDQIDVTMFHKTLRVCLGGSISF